MAPEYQAAREAALSVDPKVQVIAVTVLTSMADDDLRAVGQGDSVALHRTELVGS